MEDRRDSLIGLEARGPIEFLRSPSTIRSRCTDVLDAGINGDLEHFEVRLDALDGLVTRVLRVTREAYPDLRIPYHSRWNHFRAGGVDRVRDFDLQIERGDRHEQARQRFELAITSVLLDAGAGPKWTYRERGTNVALGRSEGLAIASYRMFLDGLFSSDPDQPLRADAEKLDRLEVDDLRVAFQVGKDNPMVGLEGRTELLSKLGSAMRAAPHLFGLRTQRLGGLYDVLATKVIEGKLPARRILAVLLEGLGPIWPGRIEIGGVNLGDVWRHPAVSGPAPTGGLVPFHKLSQWLTYSLVEPLEQAGIAVTDVDELTGLAEYRNGGLLIDDGVLVPKTALVLGQAHLPGSEVIVEWRALTVALLDRIGEAVRNKLGLSSAELPLAKVLEGGTWAAGRQAALEKRSDGSPPIQIVSDGTVF